MMAAMKVDGSATMYCQVPVSGSNTSWIIGSLTDAYGSDADSGKKGGLGEVVVLRTVVLLTVEAAAAGVESGKKGGLGEVDVYVRMVVLLDTELAGVVGSRGVLVQRLVFDPQIDVVEVAW